MKRINRLCLAVTAIVFACAVSTPLLAEANLFASEVAQAGSAAPSDQYAETVAFLSQARPSDASGPAIWLAACKRDGKTCKDNAQCCSGNCQKGTDMPTGTCMHGD